MSIRAKFEAARDRAAALAAQDERTEAEEQELTDQLDRAESLKKDLDAETEREARLDALAEVSRSVAIPGVERNAPAATEAPELTAGEFLTLSYEHLYGGMSESEFKDRAGRYIDRAQSDTSDVAGIIPESIVGPIIDTSSARRKVFDSFTAKTMPMKGKTFERPYVTQHVSIGTQADEGDDLATQAYTVDSTTVTKATQGGYLSLPRQVIDWSEPGAVDAVVMDFIKTYNRWTEGLAVTFLEALPAATTPWAESDTADVVSSYVNAVVAVYDAADDDDLPVTIWLSMDAATDLTVPQGSTDRTLWAVVKEALDALDADVSWVVSTKMTADHRIIGPSAYIESYEQKHGLLSLGTPTNLSTNLSYSGYTAFHGEEDLFFEITGT